MSMSAKEYRDQKKPKKNKYNAKKVKFDGYTFDSRAEYRHYLLLIKRQNDGEIIDLVVHPKFNIVINKVKIASYTADFQYTDLKLKPHPNRVVVDVKSPPTAKKRDFVLVKKLMLAVFGIDVIIVLVGKATGPASRPIYGADGRIIQR